MEMEQKRLYGSWFRLLKKPLFKRRLLSENSHLTAIGHGWMRPTLTMFSLLALMVTVREAVSLQVSYAIALARTLKKTASHV